MSEHILGVTRRKLLGALAVIGGGSAVAGAGAFAAFGDTANTSDSLATESIVIDKGTQTLSFQSANILPGDSGSSSVVLQSSGTAGGRLDVAISDVVNTDVESTTPEEDAEGGSNVPLAAQLEVKMWVEEDPPSSGNEGVFDPQHDYGLKSDGTVANGSGATLDFADVADYPLDTAYQTMTFADSSPTDKEFYVKWRLPSGASDAVQRDKTEIQFALTLNQI